MDIDNWCADGDVEDILSLYAQLPYQVLNRWRHGKSSSNSRSNKYQLRVNQYFSFFKLARRFDCLHALIIPAIVIDHHRDLAIVVEKPPLSEIRRVINWMLQANMFPEAGMLLREVIIQEPEDQVAQDIMRAIDLNDDGTKRSGHYDFILFDISIE